MKFISSLLIIILLVTIVFPIKVVAQTDNYTEVIAYHLKIVELSEEEQSRMGLREFSYHSLEDDIFSFFREPDIVNIIGAAGRSLINLNISNKENNTVNISDLTLLTLPGKEVSLSLSEEIIFLENDPTNNILRTEEKLEISIEPVYQDWTGYLLTNLKIKGNDIAVTTTLWSESGRDKLVGLVRWDMESSLRDNATAGERSKIRYFSVQLSHQVVTTEASQVMKIIELNQFDKLLWPEKEERIEFASYIQVLSNLDIDVMLIDYENDIALSFEAKDNFEDLRYGIDAILHEDLRAGIRGINYNGEFNLGLVISERVILSEHFKIAGSIYPIYYNFSNDEFRSLDIWSAELEFTKTPFSARVKYSSISDQEEIMVTAGYQLRESIELLAGAKGDSKGVDHYFIGIKIDF